MSTEVLVMGSGMIQWAYHKPTYGQRDSLVVTHLVPSIKPVAFVRGDWVIRVTPTTPH